MPLSFNSSAILSGHHGYQSGQGRGQASQDQRVHEPKGSSALDWWHVMWFAAFGRVGCHVQSDDAARDSRQKVLMCSIFFWGGGGGWLPCAARGPRAPHPVRAVRRAHGRADATPSAARSGAAPTAAINGVAVCLLPGSDIAGSGVQFSLQNIGKLVVPALGGMVIDYLGDKVVLGFQIVILACGFFAILTAIMGYQASLKHVQELAVGEPAKSMVPEERSTYTIRLCS